jgi:hypothetical protein
LGKADLHRLCEEGICFLVMKETDLNAFMCGGLCLWFRNLPLRFLEDFSVPGTMLPVGI